MSSKMPVSSVRVEFVLVVLTLVKFVAGQNQLPFYADLPGSFIVYESSDEGFIVANITAEDPEGETVTMSLDGIGNDLFEIVDFNGDVDTSGPSPLTRSLRLKKKLDREARSTYSFSLIVKDDFKTSGRESYSSKSLIVRDINDNSPVFLKTPYITDLKENTPSDNLYQVSADDPDLGSSGSVKFGFTEDCKLADCKLFLIDTTKGIVSLNSSSTLDYETRNRYNLDILAQDRGIPSLNSTTTLVVKVEDQSDQPPEFEKSSYRADIDENAAENTEVVQTKAFDGDRGIDKPVEYVIIGGDDNHYFKIDNSTGAIFVNSTIDRDVGIDFFELIVQATEIPGDANGTTTVFITIGDLNDNKPIFRTEGFTYTASIAENTPAGTTVFFQMGAIDYDREAKNAKFQYSISGDPYHVFSIDPSIGRIELNKSVDYEMKQQYTFLVIATETDSVEKYSANQTITVNITNINDHDPMFNQSQYNLTVNENATLGTVLGQIMAKDDDIGIYGEITYTLTGNGADMFAVDKVNGTITVASKLDFESKESYSIELEAKDGGNSLTAVSVNIVITDDNDNVPIFEPPGPTSASLDENQKDGFFVVVKATDADSDMNSAIIYSIVDGDPQSNFTIDPVTGNITNSGPLDYETQSEFWLEIMAKDQGTPALNSTKFVHITIMDKNDNEPYFNQTASYNISLMENTDIDYPLVQLHAFDRDSGVNAEILYSIVAGNSEKMFTVNVDGVLLTRSSPDRESTSLYTLNVSASDSGSPKKYAYATVVVNILDQNDDSPKFEKTVDKKIIEEGASTVNSTVANNTATDNDLGLNGTIEYEIADGNSEGKFAIGSQTGEVTVAHELDFETVRIYSLKIVATDKGTPPLLGEYQLVVEVLDINDNAPTFGQPEYSFTVTENRPVGTRIVDLLADDRDSEENKLITYSFSHGNLGSAFSINNVTGQILTMQELDRENISRYLLTVKAKDHGDPSLEGTTNITITVLDENDQVPKFPQSSYNVSVAENTARGTSVFTVTASDGDDGPAGQVTYQMQKEGNEENGNAVFSVGSISGEVKTAISLDFEKHHTFTLTLTATDNGAPKQSSNLTLYITISDTDDNPPTFTQNTWSATVQENAVLGAVIIQVNATDIDFETVHRTIYYVIVGGNSDGVFGIVYENGTVYVANTSSLNREMNDKYELTIEARTLNEFKNVTVQQTTTKLTIEVEDFNDFAPVFRESSYNKKVPESFELNEEILTVTADDEDTGVNKKISYFIVAGNEEGFFAINHTTGVLRVAKRLDRETTHAHTLIVTARDHGTPSLSSNATVDVVVTDTNDENPVLITHRTTFEILENATQGTIVAKFNATDADLNQNAEIGYRIVSGNSDGVFEINNQTGELFTVKELDHEKVTQYQIGIQAFDYGVPSLQSDIHVITIDVQDTNDNPPVFKQKSFSLSVFENEAPGAVVGTVKASDDDATDSLYYYIIGGNGATIFSINEETGVVTTMKVLDREQNSTFYVWVAVFNSKKSPEYIQTLSPPQSSSRKRSLSGDENIQLVTITVADTNDNKPYFKSNFYKAGVSENAEYESRITQITCVDNDIGNNSKLIYKVVDLQPTELLSVEPETGWILAGQQQYFASGVGKVYSFIYSCEDSSTVAETNVTIFVLVDDQRVRLTLGINDTKFVRDNIDDIKKALDDATGLEFNVDSIQYHLQSNGKYDLSKTDVFMHAVDPKTNKVVDKDTALKLIDTNYGKLINLFQRYKVNAVEPKKPDGEESGFDTIFAAAMALAVILFMLLLCFLCVICLMRRSHNRKLRAAKAIGSQDQSYGLSTPGTNLHVYEGSNPVWMDPYDNWRSEDDKNSNTAKIYEAQEVSMDMFRNETPDSRVIPGTFYESSHNGAAYHPNGILNLSMEDDENEVTNI